VVTENVSESYALPLSTLLGGAPAHVVEADRRLQELRADGGQRAGVLSMSLVTAPIK